jgi:predicted ATP-dependent endonuclease of OLD family
MLNEIRCNKFREKLITFHAGLNVVLGDNAATNSIGKSTLLMVLDFVFGGESFLTHNKDAIYELGDQDYQFSFTFDDKDYYFRRGTFKPDLVYSCTKDYDEIEPLSIEDYKAFLKSSYSIEDVDLSFRSIVSLFSRVWGKENLDVKTPLHSFKSQRASDCITNTIKLYKKFDSIKLLAEDVKNKN